MTGWSARKQAEVAVKLAGELADGRIAVRKAAEEELYGK